MKCRTAFAGTLALTASPAVLRAQGLISVRLASFPHEDADPIVYGAVASKKIFYAMRSRGTQQP